MSTLKDAQEAFRARRVFDAIEMLESVLRHGKSTDDAAAYLLKGLIYEFGGDGVPVDFERAVKNYRMSAHLIHDSDPIPFLYIARVLMKQGGNGRASALDYIQQASNVHYTPEVALAFARYHELVNDLDAAKRNYLKAMINGRFAGFFGLSSVLRKNGNYLGAFFVDCSRILFGPVLFLFLGKKARASFDGY